MPEKVGKPKGSVKTGGRQKGVPNKVNAEFREVITRLLEDNSGNFSVWLTQVATDDPGKALDLVSKLAEYAAPKLARTELTGDKENPVSLAFTWKK
jgi:hypothetical protein